MNGRYLLDTTIVIALFANEQNIQRQLGEAGEVFISNVVLGELYYGAEKSTRVISNLERINDLASTSNVIGCDLGTARQYGTIKNQLRLMGRPIPENDIWIAAQSVQNRLTLVARDAHFDEIEAISLARW